MAPFAIRHYWSCTVKTNYNILYSITKAPSREQKHINTSSTQKHTDSVEKLNKQKDQYTKYSNKNGSKNRNKNKI